MKIFNRSKKNKQNNKNSEFPRVRTYFSFIGHDKKKNVLTKGTDHEFDMSLTFEELNTIKRFLLNVYIEGVDVMDIDSIRIDDVYINTKTLQLSGRDDVYINTKTLQLSGRDDIEE